MRRLRRRGTDPRLSWRDLYSYGLCQRRGNKASSWWLNEGITPSFQDKVDWIATFDQSTAWLWHTRRDTRWRSELIHQRYRQTGFSIRDQVHTESSSTSSHLTPNEWRVPQRHWTRQSGRQQILEKVAASLYRSQQDLHSCKRSWLSQVHLSWGPYAHSMSTS